MAYFIFRTNLRLVKTQNRLSRNNTRTNGNRFYQKGMNNGKDTTRWDHSIARSILGSKSYHHFRVMNQLQLQLQLMKIASLPAIPPPELMRQGKWKKGEGKFFHPPGPVPNAKSAGEVNAKQHEDYSQKKCHSLNGDMMTSDEQAK